MSLDITLAAQLVLQDQTIAVYSMNQGSAILNQIECPCSIKLNWSSENMSAQNSFFTNMHTMFGVKRKKNDSIFLKKQNHKEMLNYIPYVQVPSF